MQVHRSGGSSLERTRWDRADSPGGAARHLESPQTTSQGRRWITLYINYPLALAQVLWSEGKVHDPVVIAPALLHDTLEDTETTRAELRGEFGPEVAGIVEEITDTKWLRKQSRKRLQIARASGLSERARLVKLAD